MAVAGRLGQQLFGVAYSDDGGQIVAATQLLHETANAVRRDRRVDDDGVNIGGSYYPGSFDNIVR